MAVLFGVDLLDTVIAGEPLQRRDIEQLAIVAGFLAIHFGWTVAAGSSDRHRLVLAEKGLLICAGADPLEGFVPWEDIVDYYWRTRGGSTTLFFHVSRSPSGPPVPVPQLGSVELGPIDDQTREQLDAVLREHVQPRSADARAE